MSESMEQNYTEFHAKLEKMGTKTYEMIQIAF
jgi:hypothetical protein